MKLTGERVTLRPIASGDRNRLGEILAEPGVMRWWGTAGGPRPVDELLEAFNGPRG
jgi:hypothetical protein